MLKFVKWVVEVINIDRPNAHFLVVADCRNIKVALVSGGVEFGSVNETGVIQLAYEEEPVVVLVIQSVGILGFLILHVPNTASSIG